VLDLGLRVVDVLLLLWVELRAEEGVLVTFHEGHEGTARVIIAYG
jgi:hypothetical protein